MIAIPIDFLKILTVAGLILFSPISAANLLKEVSVAPVTFKSNDSIYYQTQDGFHIIATNNQKQVLDWENSYALLFVGKANEIEISNSVFTSFNNGNRIFAHDSGLLFSEYQRSKVKNMNYKKELHDYKQGTSLYAGHADLDARIYQWPDNEAMLDGSAPVRKPKSVSIPILSSLPFMLTGCVFFAGLQHRGNQY
ncbi:MAG: hypothetical protein ABL925_18200 [Methylococcales bacterium]